MIRGYYTARSGLVAQQQRIDVIANNMANANTVGYKSMRTSFKDLVYQNVNRETAEGTAMTGNGVKVNKVDADMAQGSLQPSGRAYDLALTEEGVFFQVESEEGNRYFTRAGNFYVLADDDDYYLVDSAGNYILDEDEEIIELEFDDQSKLVFDPAEVGIFRIPNPHGLEAVGNNNYILTERAGEAEALEEPTCYMTGYLEGSGVDLQVEMVSMIEANRAFSLSARMTMVADEIEQTINSLR